MFDLEQVFLPQNETLRRLICKSRHIGAAEMVDKGVGGREDTTGSEEKRIVQHEWCLIYRGEIMCQTEMLHNQI